MLKRSKGAIVAVSICTTLLGGRVMAQSPDSVPSHTQSASVEAQDNIVASATVDPKLNTPFFRKIKTSFPWHIVEHEDGSLESALCDGIHADDIIRIEQTANCVSTHQGEHVMGLSTAISGKDGVELTISGGLPAYASSLVVHIAPTLRFDVAFDAKYPALTGDLRWRIKRKELRLQSATMKPGARLRGWILVEFEESEHTKDAPPGSFEPRGAYKISGYFKPVIQDVASER